MSIAWSILVIVFGGLAAITVYCLLTGGETVRGAGRLIDSMRDERRRDG